jgi:hypothetical protein
MEDFMESENNMFLDKFVLYNLAIICPFLALILAIVLGYKKNKDVLLERIKLISVYEIFEILVIGISFIYWDKKGITVSILILFVFYLFVCGIVAYKKKDYISRGVALGLFANHYSLAIMQTSEDSTARINNSKWPDSGLAAILMVFKLIFILFLLFPVNNLVMKLKIEKPVSAIELLESSTVEENNSIIAQPFLEFPIINSLSFNEIHFIANTNLFLSEGNPNTDTSPDMAEGAYEVILQQMAMEMNAILNINPDQIFVISGYTADIPSDEDDIIIARQRADRVKDILVDLGIPIENIMCIYAGGTNKWGDNTSEETKRPNRVVTIELKEQS